VPVFRLQLDRADRFNSVYTDGANTPGGLAICLESNALSQESILGPLVPKQGFAENANIEPPVRPSTT